jgi:PAS domain S-box-containing protein
VFLAGIAIERRTNEQALQESRDRYTRATAAAKVGVWEWNLETNEGYLDPNIKALAGYKAEEIECSQEAWFNLIHPDDRQGVIDLVMEHLAGCNDRFEFEHRVHHRDGRLVWVLARGTTDRDAQGRARRLVGTDSDITDRKRVEEKSKRISEFYEAIIHNAAEGICVCHPVADHPLLHFTVWNDQMTRITGYSMEEMNRLGWFECAYPDPDERPQAIERLEFAWQGDHLRSEPWVITRKDGVKRILAISTSHVIAKEGAEAMAAMMHDITDRMLAERAVRESETRFAQFVEAVPQIIWMVSTDNKRNFFVNSAYENITGLKASELSQDPLRWLEIIHPADRARVAVHLASTEEQVNVEEFRIIRADGRERWLQNRVIPILDEQGLVYMRVGLSEDITERKHAEENLAHQQVQLAKVSRFNVLGEMVAGITHEITQPLTAIANFAGACSAILESGTTESRDLRDYILEIRNQSTRAGQIVHSLRSLGRRAEASHDRCVLNELLESAIVLLNADLRQAQVEVQLQLEENNATIWADRIQIQQVLVNLVRNSCDALQLLPIHGRKIILRTWIYSSWVVIECEDNGVGLSDDCKSQLFNAFFSTKPDGMGMGLAICRTIVEAHRGRISARNNATRGATISVTLPVHLD